MTQIYIDQLQKTVQILIFLLKQMIFWRQIQTGSRFVINVDVDIDTDRDIEKDVDIDISVDVNITTDRDKDIVRDIYKL